MTDINASQTQKLTLSAKSVMYPYLESYEEFNKSILSAAMRGENSMSFDFAEGSQPKPEEDGSKRDTNRIYLDKEGGMASINVYDYPRYLESRGFKVEIREPQKKNRGYKAKSYYITW